MIRVALRAHASDLHALLVGALVVLVLFTFWIGLLTIARAAYRRVRALARRRAARDAGSGPGRAAGGAAATTSGQGDVVEARAALLVETGVNATPGAPGTQPTNHLIAQLDDPLPGCAVPGAQRGASGALTPTSPREPS